MRLIGKVSLEACLEIWLGRQCLRELFNGSFQTHFQESFIEYAHHINELEAGYCIDQGELEKILGGLPPCAICHETYDY